VEHKTTWKLIEEIIRIQPTIAHVRESFDAVPDDLFQDITRQAFKEKVIERGLVYQLVQADASGDGVDTVLFELYLRMRDLPNFRQIINEWTNTFKRNPRVTRNWEEIKEPPAAQDHHFAAYGGRGAYERAMSQQLSIIERIKRGDLDNARKFAEELIEQQRRDSAPEHLAKSLTKLSKEARDLQAFELNLEWAQRATQANPEDHRTHGQLAEALVHYGRYTEALASLTEAETFGDTGFAGTLRARILRQQNKTEEALEAYKALRQSTKDTDEEHYAWAGVAECLRDLGRIDEALQEYAAAVARFPDEIALACGHAATLAELGDVEEALSAYHRIERAQGGVVARNGIASILRAKGDLEESETAYREVVEDYPFDVVSRTGLVGVLRDRGRFDEALEIASEAVQKFPESAEALRSLGDTERQMGDLEAASTSFALGIERFPYEGRFLSALARVERDRGNYEAALSALERARGYFPTHIGIEAGRAAMFRRLGRVDEALVIYEKMLKSNAGLRFAVNAKASIAIYKGRYDEALALLQVDNPHSKDEWRAFLLRAMLDLRTGYVDAAEKRVRWGLERVPFIHVRRMFAATLVSIKLARGQTSEAADASAECVGDVTTIFRFHALASNGQREDARGLYAILQERYVPERYVEVREEIAATYGITSVQHTKGAPWILEQESTLLLLEAA
jgi:tetratricopeptide (TPR) repeat protein